MIVIRFARHRAEEDTLDPQLVESAMRFEAPKSLSPDIENAVQSCDTPRTYDTCVFNATRVRNLLRVQSLEAKLIASGHGRQLYFLEDL